MRTRRTSSTGPGSGNCPSTIGAAAGRIARTPRMTATWMLIAPRRESGRRCSRGSSAAMAACTSSTGSTCRTRRQPCWPPTRSGRRSGCSRSSPESSTTPRVIRDSIETTGSRSRFGSIRMGRSGCVPAHTATTRGASGPAAATGGSPRPAGRAYRVAVTPVTSPPSGSCSDRPSAARHPCRCATGHSCPDMTSVSERPPARACGSFHWRPKASAITGRSKATSSPEGEGRVPRPRERRVVTVSAQFAEGDGS